MGAHTYKNIMKQENEKKNPFWQTTIVFFIGDGHSPS
jgi:hypothetical protein